MKAFILLATLSLVGCASAPLTEAEMSVRVLRKSDSPKECKEVGKVNVPGIFTLNDETREQDLKRATHKAGGNTVTWDRQDENMTVFGTAWKCPNA